MDENDIFLRDDRKNGEFSPDDEQEKYEFSSKFAGSVLASAKMEEDVTSRHKPALTTPNQDADPRLTYAKEKEELGALSFTQPNLDHDTQNEPPSGTTGKSLERNVERNPAHEIDSILEAMPPLVAQEKARRISVLPETTNMGIGSSTTTSDDATDGQNEGTTTDVLGKAGPENEVVETHRESFFSRTSTVNRNVVQRAQKILQKKQTHTVSDVKFDAVEAEITNALAQMEPPGKSFLEQHTGLNAAVAALERLTIRTGTAGLGQNERRAVTQKAAQYNSQSVYLRDRDDNVCFFSNDWLERGC